MSGSTETLLAVLELQYAELQKRYVTDICLICGYRDNNE